MANDTRTGDLPLAPKPVELGWAWEGDMNAHADEGQGTQEAQRTQGTPLPGPDAPPFYKRRKLTDGAPREVIEYIGTLPPHVDRSRWNWWQDVGGGATCESEARMLVAKAQYEEYRRLVFLHYGVKLGEDDKPVGNPLERESLKFRF